MEKYLARTGIVVISLSIIIGPSFSHPDYNSISHSLSVLGGKDMPNAWIMNVGFFVYGACIISIALHQNKGIIRRREGYNRQDPHLFLGVGLIGAALIQAKAPFYAEDGNRVHSIMQLLIFVGLLLPPMEKYLSSLFKPKERKRDILNPITTCTIFACMLGMGIYPSVAGVFERAMFLINFLWIWREFSNPPNNAIA